MGQKPFPREAKLRFIIRRIGEGATDAEIQEDLLMYGPSGKMSYNEYGVFGKVGVRTLRNIRQVCETTKELIKTQIIEQSPTFTERAEHFYSIQLLIQKWKNSFDSRHRPVNVHKLPPIYSVEQEKLFLYALDHCPSVNNEYQGLLKIRSEYQAQSSELKKSQSERWQQAFIEMESKLKDALEMCLLSHEYRKHKCTLCSSND